MVVVVHRDANVVQGAGASEQLAVGGGRLPNSSASAKPLSYSSSDRCSTCLACVPLWPYR